MSDEVSHEVELALEAAAAYLREQQTEILCGINTFFIKENVLMMSQHSPSWRLLGRNGRRNAGAAR